MSNPARVNPKSNPPIPANRLPTVNRFIHPLHTYATELLCPSVSAFLLGKTPRKHAKTLGKLAYFAKICVCAGTGLATSSRQP